MSQVFNARFLDERYAESFAKEVKALETPSVSIDAIDRRCKVVRVTLATPVAPVFMTDFNKLGNKIGGMVCCEF